eukprot:14844138-Alexandrium_andersonii.AAC.1
MTSLMSGGLTACELQVHEWRARVCYTCPGIALRAACCVLRYQRQFVHLDCRRGWPCGQTQGLA